MKVSIIKNTISGKIIVTSNRHLFCVKSNLTPRLLAMTLEGKRNHHKNHILMKSGVDFIEDDEGDIVLWDTKQKGYVVGMSADETRKVEVVEKTELEKENELLGKEITKLKKQVQSYHDKNIISNRMLREDNRYMGLVDLISKEIRGLNDEEIKQWKPKDTKCNEEAILVLSDLHIGQIVDTSTNVFDLDIAKHRLDDIFAQFILEVIKRGINTIRICLLGDLIHAQSISTKPDMKLSGEFPEVQSTVACYGLLSNMIDKYLRNFNVTISGVIGNESRFSNHMLPSNIRKEAKNNMDYLIYEMLKQKYSKVIAFDTCGYEKEEIIETSGQRLLLIHGDNVKHNNLDVSLLQYRTRLEQTYDPIDMVLLGHMHSTLIGNKFARNGSLVGGNAYSDYLGFVETICSQNMLIVSPSGIKVFTLKTI